MASTLLEVDTRERELITKLGGAPIKVVQLDVGDIRISRNGGEVVAIMERKTIADLEASIKDGRWRDQKYRMLDNYGRAQVYYIVEGSVWRDGSEKAHGAIINTMLRDDIKVVFTRDCGETARVLLGIVSRVAKMSSAQPGGAGAADSAAAMPVQAHGKKAYATREAFAVHVLSAIPGISAGKAAAILAAYDGELLQVMTHAEAGDIAEIKTGGKRIGPKVAERVMEYLVGGGGIGGSTCP